MEGDPVIAVQGVNVVANIFNALLSKMSENGKLAGLKNDLRSENPCFVHFQTFNTIIRPWSQLYQIFGFDTTQYPMSEKGVFGLEKTLMTT